MSKTENLTQYECDRCGQKEIIQKGSPAVSYWHDTARLSADGVKVERLLCHSCYTEYTHLASEQDAEFAAFMENKG